MNELRTAAVVLLDALLAAEPGSVGDLDRLTLALERQISLNRVALTTVGTRNIDGIPTASAHHAVVRCARWLMPLAQRSSDDPQMALLSARTREFVAKVRPAVVQEAELVAELRAAAPAPPEEPTIWSHSFRNYSVDRSTPYQVSLEEDWALQAFLKSNSLAMNTRELVNRSGVRNVARVMSRLRTAFNGIFAAAIRSPGGRKGTGGYRIRVRWIE